ncbi:ubiquitin-conjugating enzyme domain-containing protein [Ditylenchus destructor]|uniref:E2 ubiquitin-conjugating enzyme n=1 Tax=Ditylenchus destructor TaxID=166010 RepID=A0AAD4R4M1_9BILA|nr:ubiquitin-conjugating enzyme domain-containing protein [Ditylenchus destructor]
MFVFLWKVVVLSSLTFIFVTLFTYNGINFVRSRRNRLQYRPSRIFVDRDVCLAETGEFMQALAIQNMGMTLIAQQKLTWMLRFQPDHFGLWNRIPGHYNNIWARIKRKLKIIPLISEPESNEVKYFADFRRPHEATDCNVVTLGVGFNVKAEAALAKYYPHCHFLGVDAEQDNNKDIYESIARNSRFYQGVIRGNNGPYTGGFWLKNSTIVERTVQAVGIVEFLQNHSGHDPIDLLLVDVEGAEFEILERITVFNSLFVTSMSNFPNMPILPSNSMNSIIVKRLRKEMTNMRFSTPAFVTAGPRDGDLFNWHVVLLGPPDSPYHGGVFSLRASFPPDYPYAPPKVTFNTKIYHPNIKENGEICLDILQTKGFNSWSSAMSLSSVLLAIWVLLADPNTTDPLMPEIGRIYNENRDLYNKNARECTLKYAQARKMFLC